MLPLPRMTQPRWADRVALVVVLSTLALVSPLPSRTQAGDDPVVNQVPIALENGIDLGSVGDSYFEFSPDGRTLAVTTNGALDTLGESVGPVRFWDIRTGKERASIAEGWKTRKRWAVL